MSASPSLLRGGNVGFEDDDGYPEAGSLDGRQAFRNKLLTERAIFFDVGRATLDKVGLSTAREVAALLLHGGGLAGEPGVIECDSYVAAVSQYLSCDKLPQRTRDAARQGIEKMLKAWTQRGDDIGDASKKAAAASACKTALAALEMSAAASGCPLE